jgi:hypothetical protein
MWFLGGHYLAKPEQILSTERNKGSMPSVLLDWEARRPLELEGYTGESSQDDEGEGLRDEQTAYSVCAFENGAEYEE